MISSKVWPVRLFLLPTAASILLYPYTVEQDFEAK